MLNALDDFVYNLKRVFGGIQPQEMAPQVPLVYRYTKSDAKSLRLKYSQMYNSAIHDLGLPKSEFLKVSTPILTWLSEYLIYLPASEHYHHIEPGAFYLHCIQTANKAALLAGNNSSLFFNVAIEDRDAFHRNFTFAAWLGGLIHDVGKPIADMSVYAVDRDQVWIKKIPVWNPLVETLDAWAKKYKVRWYRAVFTRNKQIEHHESYVVTFVEKVIDMVVGSSFDNRTLFDFLIGINVPTSKLYSVVKKADEMSSQHDIQRYDKVGVFNTPISHFVRALVDYEFEHTKQKRKPYFRSEIGIHINYPAGLNTLIEYMFSRMSKDDITFLKINPDPNFWVEMLRNHRFLVADVDKTERSVGGFNYIAPYIFDIQTVDDGIEQTHTCITMTRDNRVPLNVEELELKRVNIVKVSENESEALSRQENVPPLKAGSKKEDSNIGTSNSSTVSTDDIVIKEHIQKEQTGKYVSPDVLQAMDELDFTIPDIDCEIELGNTYAENAKVEHSNDTVEEPTSKTVELEQVNVVSQPSSTTNSTETTSLTSIYLTKENRIVEEIENSFSGHVVLQCCLEEKVWNDYPELIIFQIYVYEFFESKQSSDLVDIPWFKFDEDGVSFSHRCMSPMVLDFSRKDISMSLSRYIATRINEFCTLHVNEENPLFTKTPTNRLAFKQSVAKLVCYPIREKLKPMVEAKTLVI